MTEIEKRELHIHKVIDNLKTFWMFHANDMDFADVVNTIMDIDVNEYSDNDFADKLQFEVEQIADA